MQPRLTSLKVEDLRTTNAGMTRCISLAKLAANSDVPIVLLGETGTGKTLRQCRRDAERRHHAGTSAAPR